MVKKLNSYLSKAKERLDKLRLKQETIVIDAEIPKSEPSLTLPLLRRGSPVQEDSVSAHIAQPNHEPREDMHHTPKNVVEAPALVQPSVN
jgi:hypothetical protein